MQRHTTDKQGKENQSSSSRNHFKIPPSTVIKSTKNDLHTRAQMTESDKSSNSVSHRNISQQISDVQKSQEQSKVAPKPVENNAAVKGKFV